MLISRHVTRPTLATSLRVRIWDTTGSRGRVGPDTQTSGSDTSSRSWKSAPPWPTGKCSVRWRFEHNARTLSSTAGLLAVQLARLEKRNKHIRPDIIRGRAMGLLVDRSPPGKPADRVVKSDSTELAVGSTDAE